MSEAQGPEAIPNPEAFVKQLFISLAVNMNEVISHARYSDFRNALGGVRLVPSEFVPPNTRITPNTDEQLYKMAVDFTHEFGEASQLIKQLGYHFAVNDPETGDAAPMYGLGYDMPSKDGEASKQFSYIARIPRPDGRLHDIPVTPDMLIYQRHTQSQTPESQA